MNKELKLCQNCKKEFLIEPDDFLFYEKMKVPAPTWCPECRQRRRYAWRNERTLYRRNCDMCGKSTVTIYSPNKPYKVYCPPCWWSDKWSALNYGQDFDFSLPFFPQFQKLQLEVPRIALLTKNSINSEYTNHANNNKNCYLTFSTFDSENVMYSGEVTKPSQDICDCYWIENGQLNYELINAERCYKCQYSMLLRDCTNCFYCFNCRGCSDCFLSSDLQNKRYYFLNKQYTKEEYLEKISEYNLGSFDCRQKLFQDYLDLMRNKTIHRFAFIENSENVSGNMIYNSKNALRVFDVKDMENVKYITVSNATKDTMDGLYFGFQCELNYEIHAAIHAYHMMFTHLSYDNSHLQYCDTCHNSENLFGCVGVKHGSYIVFNKQYSKEEYEMLMSKIIKHMESTKEYGEFFPPNLSPFGYNETKGMIYMPLTKEEALAQGYKWEELVSGTFGNETLKSEDIKDNIKDVDASILKEALCCIKCERNYNIVKAEFDFYQRENIPIPRLCPECRYRRRILDLRLPRKLWHRRCMKPGCINEFETSYAPDRKEIVYCEQCYQQEIL